jgi:tyrosyl-tRNA synthetase
MGYMSKVITDENRIKTILDRGVVVNILPTKEAFVQSLRSGKKLRFYIGADPTSDSLHLSHAKNYMFLEELRQLGHEVIVLVGDFTAQIGDPTDRGSARKQLSQAEVKKNVKGWIKQIKPLLDFADKNNPPKILYNSKWLAKLSFKDVVELAANFTVQQMIERDMFHKRLKEKAPIHLHEFMYPLMQGYDSVAMDVDGELCGTDQTFNALAGRTLMRRLKDKEKFVITVNLMENPKTGELMSKSRGTGVFLSAPANSMYGQIMAQPDEMIEVLLVNCTRIPLEEKDAIMAHGPREAKARIAREIVGKFYGEKAALKAEKNFIAQFTQRGAPNEMPVISVPRAQAETNYRDLVSFVGGLLGIVKSNSDAWRRITQGGFELNGEVKGDPKGEVVLKSGDIGRIGRNYFRVLVD